MGGRGCAELSAALTRQQYQKPSVLDDPIAADNFEVRPRPAALTAAQFANYGQYFDWQWARSVSGHRSWFGGLRPLVTLLFLLLGGFGAVAHYRRDRASWAYMMALFGTFSVGLTFYMNFEYGYTYPLAVDFEMREVRERDYFFIVSFCVWGLWAGIGIAALWQALAERLASYTVDWRRAQLAAAPVLGLALVPGALNYGWASRHGDYMAEDWAYNVLMSVVPYGVLFTNGDNDTFPLWHLQEVEGIRRDVTVIVSSYLNTPWYARQIRDLTQPCATPGAHAAQPTRIVCQRPFDAQGTPYTPPRTLPDDSVLPLTSPQIEQVARMAYRLDAPAVLSAARLETTVPAGTYLAPADTFVAAILRAALGVRPIHFMAPHPALVRLNLVPFTVRTGLTLRLAERPVEADGERIVALEERDSAATGRYIDRPLTDTLLGNVFRYRSAPETDRPWVDSATTDLLLNYVAAHIAAARGAAAAGDATSTAAHVSRADTWAQLIR